MKSSVVKRSVVIGGHKTSVSLEEPFWIDLKAIARAQHITLSAMIGQIDGTREQSNLSSAIRLFVLHHVRIPEHGSAESMSFSNPAAAQKSLLTEQNRHRQFYSR